MRVRRRCAFVSRRATSSASARAHDDQIGFAHNDREPKKNVVRVFPIESNSNFQRERTRETNEEAPELLADRHQRAREEIAPPFEEKKTRREDTSTF